ncbi:hypothetical protein [Thermofilum pendens]|uniref:Uncharacterized protein n=1 Tax=Thermofilum pendens (strain DSM 2475 / Hrk 5) TaxID=368408 RepID=A1RXZ5_THEPD|nr:hypothetical protein [Thermofilum pendens]ABL78075.1 hypothetical protein Tpen_0673 [Thermofilum pendens Hrk 5]
MGRKALGSVTATLLLLLLSTITVLLAYPALLGSRGVARERLDTRTLLRLLHDLENGGIVELPVEAKLLGNASFIAINGKVAYAFNSAVIVFPQCESAPLSGQLFKVVREGSSCTVVFRPYLNLSAGEVVAVAAYGSGLYSRLNSTSVLRFFRGFVDELVIGQESYAVAAPLKLKVKVIEVRGVEGG